MSNLNAVIPQLNEQAIRSMRNREFAIASSLLSHGIQQLEEYEKQGDLKEENVSNPHSSGNTKCNDIKTASSVDQGSTFCPNFGLTSPSNASYLSCDIFVDVSICVHEMAVDAGSFRFFTKALTIPRSSLDIVYESDYHILCAILLYNIGLTLQLQGAYDRELDRQVHQERQNNNYLQEALLSYEMALGLLSMADDHPWSTLVELALLNNCVAIHYLNGLQDTVSEQLPSCIDRMRFLFQIVISNAKHTNGYLVCASIPRIQVPTRETLRFMALNLMHSAMDLIRPASAA